MDNQKINQYRIVIKINNLSSKMDSDALSLLQDELSMRPHLISSELTRIERGENFDISLAIIYSGVDASSVSEQVSEEMFEIGSAILSHIEGVYIEVQSVELI